MEETELKEDVEVGTVAPESTEEVVQDASTTTESPKPKSKEDNLRKLGAAYEDLKRKNEELQQALIRTTAPPAPKEEADELDGLADDDFVSVAQVKKLAEKIAKQSVTQAMKAGRVAQIEERFARKHSDYDDVVNSENFEKLFEDMPEMRPVLARAYEAATKGEEDIDPVALSYKLLKPYAGEPTMPKRSAAEDKLTRNSQKPLSGNAIKSSALTEVNKSMNGGSLTKDERARLYKETVAASRVAR